MTWRVQICKALSFILAAHMIHIGIWAFVSPSEMSKNYGVPTCSDPTDLANAWIYVYGGRELVYGIAILISSCLGRWKASGTLVLLVVPLAALDTWVDAMYGVDGLQRALLVHGVATPILGLTAGTLLTID